jgi:hypothetical protein
MTLAACLTAAGLAVSTPATIATIPVQQLQGRGAVVPFTEYEAENACFTGRLIGPSRALYTIAAEASGRRSVRLDQPGQFVEFTLAKPANAVTVRYATPDSPDGSGVDAALGVFVGGERLGSLALTSRYGWFYGAYPFTNRPSDGGPHHVFDESRLLLGRELPAGTKVRLQVASTDRVAWTVVDLADFEMVPAPRSRPVRSISAIDFGADASGVRESSGAFRRSIAAALQLHRPVWIGPGTYRIDGHLALDGVTIAGAGPWYSILRGQGVGLYGSRGASGVHLSHFAIIGDVRERNDKAKLAGIGGTFGGGSTLDDLWLQHLKSGVWLDGPSSGVTIRNLRILDTTADGINLRRGVRNASIQNVFVRNSGDDGIALWSHFAADADDVIAHNTVVAPILANGIAVYGGHDIRVEGNLVADTLTQAGGIHLGNRFDAVPLSGAIRLSDNLLVRTGSYDPNWRFGIGALWFYALDHLIDADVRVSDTQLMDSTFEAIQLIGKPVRTVRLDGLLIDGASRWLQVQAGGAAEVTDLVVKRVDDLAYGRCDSGFSLRLRPVLQSIGRASNQACGPLDPKTVERRLAQ